MSDPVGPPRHHACVHEYDGSNYGCSGRGDRRAQGRARRGRKLRSANAATAPRRSGRVVRCDGIARGLTCCLMTGLAVRKRAIRAAVTTIDPDPLVTLSVDSAYEKDMCMPELSGPERWDYYFETAEAGDRYFLHIEAEGQSADIPLLPSAAAIVLAHGWTEDTALSAAPLVNAVEFNSAVAALTASTQSVTLRPTSFRV